MNRINHGCLGAILAASLCPSCSLGLNLEPPPPKSARPACDDPVVVTQIIETANTHPDQSPSMPSLAFSLSDIRETRAREIPNVGSATFQRLCVGVMTLQSGEVMEIGWEIFTTDTILGPAYGLDACYGPYDRAGRDCAAFAQGRIPGEIDTGVTRD